jgi:CHAD domain-containing protein
MDATITQITQLPHEPAPQRASQPQIANAVPVPDVETLGARDPMIVFAYACLRRELAALLAQQPAPGTVPQPEAIHQMRIATRRLRVALRTFGNMLPADDARAFAGEFRWFAQTLGEVRDLDVYAEHFRDYAKLVPPEQQPELGGYELHLRRQRAQARAELERLFVGERVGTLLTGFRHFLEGAPTTGALRRWRSFRVGDGAAEYLRASKKRVLRAGRKIAPDSPAEKLHRLRIRAKRLRYELEFFAKVFPELEKAAKAAKQLQELLGEHQDACTASDRLREYARATGTPRKRAHPAPATPGALDRLLATQEQKAADARQRFASEWERFERTVRRLKLTKLAA